MKNNKILVGVLVIFIILTICLGGYIVYDKLLSNDNLSDDINKNVINDVSMFPMESIGDVLSTSKESLLYDKDRNYLVDDAKNVINEINGIKYSLSCESFGEVYQNYCDMVKISFDSFNTNLYYNNTEEGCGDATWIIISDEYFIEQELSGCGNGGELNVYNNNGNIVFSDNNSVYMISDDASYKMAVVDNILYYVTYDLTSEDSSGVYTLYFKFLNLSNMENGVIQNFRGRLVGLKD